MGNHFLVEYHGNRQAWPTDGKCDGRVLYGGLEGSSAIYAKQHTAP